MPSWAKVVLYKVFYLIKNKLANPLKEHFTLPNALIYLYTDVCYSISVVMKYWEQPECSLVWDGLNYAM